MKKISEITLDTNSDNPLDTLYCDLIKAQSRRRKRLKIVLSLLGIGAVVLGWFIGDYIFHSV